MHTLSLNGTWQVRPEEFTCSGESGCAQAMARADGWLPAQVPGEIHLDLMRAGQMPDPAVGNNAPQCRWPETKSWWYRTEFAADSAFLAQERQQLVFDGLDLYAQVFLNDRLVGEAANAFVPAVFDVKRFLRAGANALVVRLTAGSELAADATSPGQGNAPRPNPATDGAIPNPARDGDLYGHRIWPGKKWLRKPQFTYGWDWVDALPNIGIWRGVRLEGRSHAVLADIRLDTVREGRRVLLELEAIVENLHPWSERRCVLSLEVRPPGGGRTVRRRYDLDAAPGRQPVRDRIAIPQPQLWWPNGMGAQPLYEVTARVTDAAGALGDERTFCIGLRTIEIDLARRTRLGEPPRQPPDRPDHGTLSQQPFPALPSALPEAGSPTGSLSGNQERTHEGATPDKLPAEGSRFCVRVNGQDVFCRGGNIGPHDIIPARISDAKYEALVAEARNANMTMIRINGCSIFEGPAFYDACDRMGILVWHDFMLTCTTYPEENAAFTAAVCAESEAAVKLLRHHPSIALWCGNNECTWGFRDWWNPDKTKPLELGGQALYNRLLPDLCRQLDPRRPYWVSSPAGGDEPNGELAGDCHWWGPFFMNPDMNRRIRHEVFDECRARFVSEYGVIGPCHLDSIREYLAPEEMRTDSTAWRVHTNMFEKETMPAAIRRHYADPETLSIPEYVRYGQLFQALIHGYAMEALRFRKLDAADDCQGALIWSYSDCWGETGWSILDYYLRRKASYYSFRRACAPLKVIVRRRGERLVTRLINDTMAAAEVTVDVGWWRLDGRLQEVERHSVSIAANGVVEVASEPVPPAAERDPQQWLYAAVLSGPDGVPCDQSVLTFAPHRELALAAPEIRVTPLADGWLEVASPVFCHAVHAEDHGRELLSDNWFDLLPGVPVRVRLAPGAAAPKLEAIGRRD